MDVTPSSSKDINVLDAPGPLTSVTMRIYFEDQEAFDNETTEEVIRCEEELRPELEDTTDTATQASSKLSASTPRKKALKLKIRLLKNKKTSPRLAQKSTVTLEDVSKFFDENYPTLSNLIKTQLTLFKKSPKGSRYSDEYKQFALTIYFLGPKAYRYLSKTFRLPSKSTLFRVTQKWNINIGFSEFVFLAVDVNG